VRKKELARANPGVVVPHPALKMASFLHLLSLWGPLGEIREREQAAENPFFRSLLGLLKPLKVSKSRI